VVCPQAFNDWCNTIDAEFVVKKITVQSVDMFGPRMGFVKFKGDITDEQGRVIPSIVFMRGASVGMLIVITCEEDKRQYTVLTVQPRVPTGKYALEELPAGMLDASGSFVGAAAKELQEETGIIVNEKGLIDLTEKAFKGTAYNHVYPSAGGCDEILRLFLYQVINQSDMFCDHVCFVRAWKSRPARPALVHIGGACCHLSRKHIPKFIAEKISPYWCM
jgi:ADP-sugar diphosphatase